MKRLNNVENWEEQSNSHGNDEKQLSNTRNQ